MRVDDLLGTLYIVTAALSALLIAAALLVPSCAHARDGRLDRCEPYRAAVMAVLDDEGVPPDYYYLMVAESGCRKGAESDRGAVGFWQLMPYTARHYECTDPHDVECATYAAARYLLTLIRRFERFEDVIAAYNMGGTNLKRRGMTYTREAAGLVYTVKRLLWEDKNGS